MAQTLLMPNKRDIRPAGQPKTAEAVRAGDRLRQAREAMSLSRQELSDRIGGVLSPSRIGNYEQGLRELGIKEAEMLAPALGTNAAYLMGLINNRELRILQLPPEVHNAILMAAGIFQGLPDKDEPRLLGLAKEVPSTPARIQRR